MVSSSRTHHQRRSYTADEVVDAVFIDEDSAGEYMQSESSESQYKSCESEESVATPEPISGNAV